MNNKDKKAFLTKIKLLISAGLLCTSLNVNAAGRRGTVKAIGNPEYAQYLAHEFNRMPYEIDKFILDNNINIYFLPYTNSAEAYWQKDDDPAPGNISGFTSISEDGSKKELDVFVEACIKPGYYERYASSSEGLTQDEFNYRICKGTLMHELGHAIDVVCNYSLSDNKEFKYIYSQEKNRFRWTSEYRVENLKVDANINTTGEYFATAFAAFVCHPKNLYENCPLTYRYIEFYAKKIAGIYIDDASEIEEKYGNREVENKNYYRYQIIGNRINNYLRKNNYSRH